MVMARYHELCMDAAGDDTLGRFWADLVGLGWRADPEGGLGDPVGEHPWQTIAMCPVPEPKTAKHRVHLDVYARSVADVEALGGRVLARAEQTGLPWTVMADPEGGEFCVFLREEPPPFRWHGLSIDAVDAGAIAAWWAEVLGGTVTTHDGWVELAGAVPGAGLTFDFAPVPEPKTVKNRVHWDVEGPLGTTRALEAHGAVRLWEEPRWTVLADPQGNEFCVFEREGLVL